VRLFLNSTLVTSFGISSPAIVVPRVSLRFPSESDCRGPACHSVRVDGVALNIAHPINLENFEMSDVGVAVPGLDTVGSGSASDTETVSQVIESFTRSDEIQFSSLDENAFSLYETFIKKEGK